MQRNGIESVHRAVDLLSAFSREQPALPLGAIAKKTNLPKPTAFRLLATLRSRGLINQDPASGFYSLGFGVLALAAVRSEQTKVREEALPILKRIRDAVNETTVLSVRVGEHRVHVEQVESRLPIRRSVELGEHVPLYAGAASKVLLASMEDEEIRSYLQRVDLRSYGPTTTIDPAELLRQVEIIRLRGYAEGVNERSLGGVGVAAAVRDHRGSIVAAMHISVPQFRYDSDMRERCVRAVLDGAREVSIRLGFQPQSDSL